MKADKESISFSELSKYITLYYTRFTLAEIYAKVDFMTFPEDSETTAQMITTFSELYGRLLAQDRDNIIFGLEEVQ